MPLRRQARNGRPSQQSCYTDIVEGARIAVHQAYEEALASGIPVLVSKDGVLYEVRPDGTRSELKRIEPPTLVQKGQKLSLS